MLKDVIREDFTKARKTGNTVAKNALEAIIASILLREKAGKGEASDADVIDAITKEMKVQSEIVELYKNANPDKSLESQKRIEVLNFYMPKQFTEEEVLEIIKKADVYEDNSPKTKGLIIKTIMPELAGKYNKALINPLVEKYLLSK